MTQVYIGTSGYSYKHWKDVFYPDDLPGKNWLAYYCQHFSTVELNVTFYRMPSEKVFQTWYENTPENFIFAIKAPQIITHYKKLINIDAAFNTFLARLSILKGKVGVILWQLPPNLQYEKERFENFSAKLESLPYKLAFEFRNSSWFNEEVYEDLFKLNAAVVQSDWPFFVAEHLDQYDKRLVETEVFEAPETADFAYLRRHGATALYASRYEKGQLMEDAESIKRNKENGRESFVYFNNDAEGYAIQNAKELIGLI